MNAVMLQLPGVMRMPVATTQWEDTIVPVTLIMKEMDLSAVNFTPKYGATSKVNLAQINHSEKTLFQLTSISVHAFAGTDISTVFAIYHCLLFVIIIILQIIILMFAIV